MGKCTSLRCPLCFCQRSPNLICFKWAPQIKIIIIKKKLSTLHQCISPIISTGCHSMHILSSQPFSLLSNPLFFLVLKHTHRLYSYIITSLHICWKKRRKKISFLLFAPSHPSLFPSSIFYFLRHEKIDAGWWEHVMTLLASLCVCVCYSKSGFSYAVYKTCKVVLVGDIFCMCLLTWSAVFSCITLLHIKGLVHPNYN